MIFKDRAAAGEKLAALLKKDYYFKRSTTINKLVVVSLLRGGVVVGNVVAKSFNTKHIPLVVTKIPAPGNFELAIGALCFETIYLESQIIKSLGLEKIEISNQIEIAREKFNSYLRRFKVKKSIFSKELKNKIIVLVDDGIATGASIKAAYLFLKQYKPHKIILAVPVGPADFDNKGFDKIFILHKDASLSAVSQFYEYFPQVEDEEVRKILNSEFRV